MTETKLTGRKFEIATNKKNWKVKKSRKRIKCLSVSNFEFLSFEFVSDLDIRISYFSYCPLNLFGYSMTKKTNRLTG